MHTNPLKRIEAGNQKATAIAHLCKRVRFRQSECRECVEVCPTEAISLTLGPVIADSCDNCGLCEIACPTEALENVFNADAMLEEFLRTEEITDGKLYMHCSEAKPHDNSSFGVNCAGNITENGMLSAAKNNIKQLLLTTGQCEQCGLNKGMQLFQRAANVYKQLAMSVCNDAIEIKIRIKTKPTQSETAVSRRAFLNQVSNKVVRQAARVIVEKEQAIHEWLDGDDSEAKTKRGSPRRAALRQLLQDVKRRDSENTVSTSLPWKAMRVDEPKCVGCGICVAVCPTGALEKQVDAAQLTRYIYHALCTNCDLCAEACPHNIIHFDRAYTIDDITEDSKTIVAKVALNNCLFCGETIPVSEGEVCTTCQKRQVIPMFTRL